MGDIRIKDVLGTMILRKPVTVLPKDRLKKALEIMSKNDFSQLPVVEDGKLRGLLSYKSIVKQIELQSLDEERAKNTMAVCDMQVRHFTDPDPDVLSLDDSIFTLFKKTRAEEAILIGKSGKEPKYILTNYDVVDILAKLSEVFLLVEQIEESVRNIIKKQLAKEGLSYKEAVQKVNQNMPEERAFPEEIEKMSWENYKEFINRKECWNPYFCTIFDSRSLVEKYFSVVRDLRNDVFHFRKLSYTLDASETRKLKKIRAWLKNFE